MCCLIRSRISKRANRKVRRRLYEATLSAAYYNPSVRAIYRRLKESGKPEKVARTAAPRSQLSLWFRVVKQLPSDPVLWVAISTESGESFRIQHQEEPKRISPSIRILPQQLTRP
ncbi:transposase [Candidatus Bipolaricaulota bacterium]|nr:transposase [Candidatus Bipolaricaulota bacterium]